MQLVPVTCWLLQRKSTERYIANCAKIPGALGRQSLYLFCHAQDTRFKDNPRHDSGIQKSIAFLRPVNANRNGTVLVDHWWLHCELPLGKFPYVSSFSQTNKTSCYRCRAHLLGYQGGFSDGPGKWRSQEFGPWKKKKHVSPAWWLEHLHIQYSASSAPWKYLKDAAIVREDPSKSNGKHATSSCCTIFIFVTKYLDDQLDSESSAFRG